MAPQILFIGIGNMGRGMAKNLAEKGGLDRPLLLYNRTRRRAEDLAAALPAGRAEVADSLADGVRRADVVFSVLSNDAAVREVVDAALALGGGLGGKLFVECSTIHPDAAEQIARDLTAAGAEVVVAPVWGAPAVAEAGGLVQAGTVARSGDKTAANSDDSALSFIPAGPKSSIDRARPYFTGVMGRAEIPFEDQAYGKSSTLKLVGNSFLLNMVAQMGETMTLAEKSGAGTGPFQQFVDLLFGGVLSAYATRMSAGTYWRMAEPLFSADNARKDLGHARSLADRAGMGDLRYGRVSDELYGAVAAHAGGARGDVAGAYGAVRKASGLRFENDEDADA
ncbi:NAD binding domain of 6-phosphogluconate dehydrogenase-domain-containing protein [Xylariaceae sp. FL0804]|nr:NAD binding domain of 6-phosphogluconate dehydrogenase-domain-containing protein [Xylariaceae sp. FL0804]